MRHPALHCIGAVVFLACQGASSSPSSAQSVATSTSPEAVSASRRTALTEAVARVAPAVVTVQTEVMERVPVDAFEQFFGGRVPAEVFRDPSGALARAYAVDALPDTVLLDSRGAAKLRFRGARKWLTQEAGDVLARHW